MDMSKATEQKCWIVWNNADKGEGVVFDNQDDAKTAATGKRRYQTSTLAEFFHEAYGEEGDLPIEEIGLAAVNAYDPKRDAAFEAMREALLAVQVDCIASAVEVGTATLSRTTFDAVCAALTLDNGEG